MHLTGQALVQDFNIVCVYREISVRMMNNKTYDVLKLSVFYKRTCRSFVLFVVGKWVMDDHKLSFTITIKFPCLMVYLYIAIVPIYFLLNVTDCHCKNKD